MVAVHVDRLNNGRPRSPVLTLSIELEVETSLVRSASTVGIEFWVVSTLTLCFSVKPV